jgi:two-component system sensor histidine kinase LytS
MDNKIIGTLKLYKNQANAVGISDIELAKGLAYLFSTQLELSKLEYHEKLLAKSELKALQAQIHPHFLFNALNTVISFCRTNPDKARMVLTKLSNYLRFGFQNNKSFIPIICLYWLVTLNIKNNKYNPYNSYIINFFKEAKR